MKKAFYTIKLWLKKLNSARRQKMLNILKAVDKQAHEKVIALETETHKHNLAAAKLAYEKDLVAIRNKLPIIEFIEDADTIKRKPSIQVAVKFWLTEVTLNALHKNTLSQKGFIEQLALVVRDRFMYAMVAELAKQRKDRHIEKLETKQQVLFDNLKTMEVVCLNCGLKAQALNDSPIPKCCGQAMIESSKVPQSNDVAELKGE